MALIKCDGCGQIVSDKAKACPHCGTQVVVDENNSNQAESNLEETLPKQEYSHEVSKRKSNVGLIVALALGILAVLGVGGWLWYDGEQKRAEQERQLALLAEKARQDSIVEAELREQARQDSIAEAQKQEQINRIYNEYVRILNMHHDGGYFLFDITRDGIPELWVHAHNYNEKRQGYCAPLHVFTILDKKAKELAIEDNYMVLIEFGSYYQGKGCIIEFYNDVGDGYCYTILVNLVYNGNKIIRKTIKECDCEENVQISEPKISELELTDFETLNQKIIHFLNN